MKEVVLIVAVSKNNVIGKDNKLLWHISKDLKRFKELTLNHPIIMGRKTFMSLPFKPLPKRINIVLSRNLNSIENVIIKKTLEEAISYAKTIDDKIFIIGGSSVYKEALDKNLVDRMEITKLDKEYEGDSFFPKIDLNKWEIINNKREEDFSFISYIKKSERL